MINDVLEQVVEDYFREKGYFTQHNVKYKPNKKGPAFAVHSDIDVIGVNPKEKGAKRVIVVSCKSWYTGLDIRGKLKLFSLSQNEINELAEKKLKRLNNDKKKFRELINKEWSKALRNKVLDITGEKQFKFYLAVTKYDEKDRKGWENFYIFKKNLPGCKISLIDMKEMVLEIQNNLTRTPSNNALTGMLRLIKADDGKIEYKNK